LSSQSSTSEPPSGGFWVVDAGGIPAGPLDTETIRSRVREGRLSASALVRGVGATEWQPLGSAEPFSELFARALGAFDPDEEITAIAVPKPQRPSGPPPYREES